VPRGVSHNPDGMERRKKKKHPTRKPNKKAKKSQQTTHPHTHKRIQKKRSTTSKGGPLGSVLVLPRVTRKCTEITSGVTPRG